MATGDYDLRILVTDNAGNSASATDTVKIDTQAAGPDAGARAALSAR